MQTPPNYVQPPPTNLFYSQSTKPPYLGVSWSSGICDCCGQDGNPGFFCLACCCGSIAQGVLIKDLGLVSSCACPVVLYTALDLLFARSFMCLILLSLRTSMSDRLMRGEGPCCSLCIACCCYPCALAQMDRDLKAKGRSYVFDKAEGAYQEVTTYFGAIHGSARPYVSSEMVPLVNTQHPI
jgi:Cys-rich protein (TIGR01571 family)